MLTNEQLASIAGGMNGYVKAGTAIAAGLATGNAINWAIGGKTCLGVLPTTSIAGRALCPTR